MKTLIVSPIYHYYQTRILLSRYVVGKRDFVDSECSVLISVIIVNQRHWHRTSAQNKEEKESKISSPVSAGTIAAVLLVTWKTISHARTHARRGRMTGK